MKEVFYTLFSSDRETSADRISETLAIGKWFSVVEYAIETALDRNLKIKENSWNKPSPISWRRDESGDLIYNIPCAGEFESMIDENLQYSESKRLILYEKSIVRIPKLKIVTRLRAYSDITLSPYRFGSLSIKTEGDVDLVDGVSSTLLNAKPVDEEHIEYLIKTYVNKNSVTETVALKKANKIN